MLEETILAFNICNIDLMEVSCVFMGSSCSSWVVCYRPEIGQLSVVRKMSWGLKKAVIRMLGILEDW